VISRRDVLVIVLVLALAGAGLWIARVEKRMAQVNAASANIVAVVNFLNDNIRAGRLAPPQQAQPAKVEPAQPEPTAKPPAPKEK